MIPRPAMGRYAQRKLEVQALFHLLELGNAYFLDLIVMIRCPIRGGGGEKNLKKKKEKKKN